MRFRKTYLAAAAAILAATGGCDVLDGEGGGAAPLTADALQAAAQDDVVRRFYEARQWQPAWTEQSEQQLVETIRGASRHALNPTPLLRDIGRSVSPVAREIALTRAALTYAGALAHGATDPSRVAGVYTVPRNRVDLARGLADAIAQDDVGGWIEAQAPQDEEYRSLSNAYLQMLQAQRQQQEQQAGDAAQQNVQANAQSDSEEPQRVQANQVPPDERAVVLAVNMERRRWLERSPPSTRIDVNTAGSFLRYFRDGALVDQRVVVNGEPGWETPQLGSPIFRLVANPTWTVPESIEQDELAGLSPAQLARRNIVRDGERLVQQPGPQNALGLVKFDMQNDHAIYLHDTPAKQMFARSERHLSHGCVRVQDALGFARLIAQHDGKLHRFERALRNDDVAPGEEIEPSYVNLDRPIPVRLLYHTAYLDNGRLTFAPDAYGWDAAIAEALGMTAPEASREALRQARQERAQRQQGVDLGP